jgi:hypothetical protein
LRLAAETDICTSDASRGALRRGNSFSGFLGAHTRRAARALIGAPRAAVYPIARVAGSAPHAKPPGEGYVRASRAQDRTEYQHDRVEVVPWSLRITGAATMTNAALGVTKNDPTCQLAVTALMADTIYESNPSITA